MIVAAASSPIRSEMDWFAQFAWVAPPVRTHLQFCLDELVIPEGKFKGERYREHTQPWTGLLLREMDNPQWYTFAITGCVQSGKSLFGFVVPVLKRLFDDQETAVLGVPTVDEVGRDKWTTEVKPTIKSSGYAGLLPTRGPGSQDGFPKEVCFQHGPRLKIMGGAGGDEKRSSYSTGFVAITEVDKMDEAGEVSRETDPISQMIARTMGRDVDERRVFLECTVSHTEGRIWQEYINGSQSRIACPCPHCGEYVTPERESLRGWQDAVDAMAAEENAYFVCPACEHQLTPAERRVMNQTAVLVHKGQEIDKEGKITGPMPRTRTLGFRWNAFNNMFWSAGAIGVAEWDAQQSEDSDAAEKKLQQFYWATPWDPPQVDLAPIDPRRARRRYGVSRQGFVPAGTQALTMGVDVHKRYCVWHLTAHAPDGSPHVVDHDEFAVPSTSMSVETAIVVALKSFRDETVLDGWPLPDGELIIPDQVWIDSRYQPVAVKTFCRESGERFRPIQGLGYGPYYQGNYSHPLKTSANVRHIGDQYHLVWEPESQVFVVKINADAWKSFWHERLITPLGEAGSATLYHSTKDGEHRELIHQYTSEKQFQEFIPDLGLVTRWKRIRAKNHKFDCAYIASAAGHFCGVRLIKQPVKIAKQPAKSNPFLTPNGEPYLITERQEA